MFDKVITYNDGKEKEMVSKTEWELITPHDARHSFITDLSAKNLTPEQIAIITGHATTSVLKTNYIHINGTMLDNQFTDVMNILKAS